MVRANTVARAHESVSLSLADRERVVAELGRDPTRTEAALFENLWSEHCAYRSSRPLLAAFDSEGDRVVVGPGDDAAVIAVGGTANESDTYLTFGVESHNHPSYVDPYDGAATGVGGIVRDTMSMGAYPVALADVLYFGPFADDHPRYLLDGVVDGISDYGNAIGVPTVAGSVAFHPDYEGNPLVNVACVGLTSEDRYVTAEAQTAGNALVLVGNATGRDGLGGAAFASEDLDEDAKTEDRPAVQVGDPYAEKRLIEANEALLDEDLVVSARDLGAAGLGGASCELVAKGGLGARIDLDEVHLREEGMNATEILLSESQERMCYEARPEDIERVMAVADRFDLGVSVIGEVTEGDYICRLDGETVVTARRPTILTGPSRPGRHPTYRRRQTSRMPSRQSSPTLRRRARRGSTGSTTTRSACERSSDRARTRRFSLSTRRTRTWRCRPGRCRRGPPTRRTRAPARWHLRWRWTSQPLVRHRSQQWTA